MLSMLSLFLLKYSFQHDTTDYIFFIFFAAMFA